jgi:3-oxoacyl-[acyl-carrier protein] reductase
MDKKVVFITGASRGIGLATAKKFVSEGWEVAGFYTDKAVTDIEGVKYFQVNVADWDSIQKGFGQAWEYFKRIDCLVNCAGIYGYKTLAQYDIETMEKLIGVNEMGTYLTGKWVAEKMEKGSMVFITSTAAQVGSSDPVYAGTKAAVQGFVKSLAKALAPNIRVNGVAPGVTDSGMTKDMNPERLAQLIDMSLLKKVGQPEDIANGIYFLASDQASHITGACLDINGGYVLR